MAEYDFNPSPSVDVFNLDQWDGYVAARDRFLGFDQRQPASQL